MFWPLCETIIHLKEERRFMKEAVYSNVKALCQIIAKRNYSESVLPQVMQTFENTFKSKEETLVE